MLDMQQFADKLKKYRKARGITQNEIAQELGITAQSVSKWERGEVMPDIEHLCDLSRILCVSLDVLLNHRPTDRCCLIGIDGGATKTEFVIIDETGQCLNTIVLEGCNPNTCGVDKAVEILRRGIDYLRPQEMHVVGIYLGGAGMASGNYADVVRTALEKAYPNLKVGCSNDISNVIACSESPELCVAAISGTGCVVYSKENGQLRRFGGTGYLFEGSGSGYDIGRDAITAALRARDGLGEFSLLTELVEQKLGGPAWDSIQALYRQDVAYIASFSVQVSLAAEQGDPIAQAILERNAAHMGQLIRTACAYVPAARHVILSGSLFARADRFFQLVIGHLESGLKIERVTCPPVWGACLQAARMCGLKDMPSLETFTRSRSNMIKGESCNV